VGGLGKTPHEKRGLFPAGLASKGTGEKKKRGDGEGARGIQK